MRYFKATLLIGIVSIVTILILDASGWIWTLEVLSAQVLARFSPSGPLAWASHGFVLSIAALAGFAFAWTTVDISRPAAKSAVAFSGIFLLFSGAVICSLYGIFFSPFQAVLTAFLSYVIAMGYGGSDSGARKRVLKRLFGQRLSREQFARLVDSHLPLHFPGAEQSATVVVCEVHNHVELLESLTAADYVAMTNLYLKTASDYLVDAGGYLDECGGESLRVVFGAPLPRGDHAIVACKAALELTARIETLNKECDSRWHQRLDFRVGINSGSMIAAAYGGSRVGSFSVAGTTVEFARRLCAACANYGCRILVGSETYAEAGEFVEARPIELLRRADGQRLELYEVLAPVNSLSPERTRSREHFWKGVIYYRDRRWDLALEEFSKARVTGLPDPGLDAYVLRTERARRGDASAPATPAVLAEIS
ncbi:MAG: adenylate/guanylate cyclase domain-containing protein [Terrimicrobiaceae bacterium]|nr:adenylate/guanylate cyclase domain-containing protein [Terrimicrobiaceae bacterium]